MLGPSILVKEIALSMSECERMATFSWNEFPPLGFKQYLFYGFDDCFICW
jgi:hypothetical protein